MSFVIKMMVSVKEVLAYSMATTTYLVQKIAQNVGYYTHIKNQKPWLDDYTRRTKEMELCENKKVIELFEGLLNEVKNKVKLIK